MDFPNLNQEMTECEACDGTGREHANEDWAEYVELDQLPECMECNGQGLVFKEETTIEKFTAFWKAKF